MNVCTEYEALLDLYVDGELTAEEMLRVANHVEGCPACRDYVDAAMLIRADFPDEESIPLPEGFHERVMAAVAAEAPRPAKKKRPYAMFAPLAAACLAVVVAVSGGGRKEIASVASAPAASAPMVAQYSMTADMERSLEYTNAAPAAQAPMEAPAAAEPCAPAMGEEAADALVETEAQAYLAVRTVTKAEAEEHLSSYEAMEYEGRSAYELTMAEYAALCAALGVTEEFPDAEGMVLVTIQE